MAHLHPAFRSLLEAPDPRRSPYNRIMATTPEAPVAAQSKYEPVIGLEVHVQLLTRTKIFCGCSTQFGDPPEHQCLPGVSGFAGAVAGVEPAGG